MDRPFGGRRVTIGEVAALAGVSKTTVSHVLSGRRPVAAATRARVERAVEELSFRPDRLARSLRTRRSHTAALIIPDITNPFFPVLARGMEDELSATGYRTFICNTDADARQELEFAFEAFHRRVDGIALVALHLRAKELRPLIDYGLPLVSIGGHIRHRDVDLVAPDDRRGAHDATTRLIERGARRIAMIQGARGSGTDRIEGYRLALLDGAVRPDDRLMVRGDWTRAGGARAMRELMALEDPPDAVFCGNDMMAIGAMDTARELGLSIPRDVALVGYDDIEAAALVHPALTTVLNPAYETGQAAARLLLDRMQNGYAGGRRVEVLECKLVERDSA